MTCKACKVPRVLLEDRQWSVSGSKRCCMATCTLNVMSTCASDNMHRTLPMRLSFGDWQSSVRGRKSATLCCIS